MLVAWGSLRLGSGSLHRVNVRGRRNKRMVYEVSAEKSTAQTVRFDSAARPDGCPSLNYTLPMDTSQARRKKRDQKSRRHGVVLARKPGYQAPDSGVQGSITVGA